jgi:hypothetical protein
MFLQCSVVWLSLFLCTLGKSGLPYTPFPGAMLGHLYAMGFSLTTIIFAISIRPQLAFFGHLSRFALAGGQ